MASTNNLHYTLYLWPEGLYPRRLTYYLLLKGLVSSPHALIASETTVPNLSLNLIRLNPSTFSWEGASAAAETKPEGKSLPCLRIDDPDGKPDAPPRWVHESNSILCFLEEAYGPTSKSSRYDNENSKNKRDVSGAWVDAAAQLTFTSLRGTSTLDRALVADMLALIDEAGKDASYYLRHASRYSASFWAGIGGADRSRSAGVNARDCMRKSLAKLLAWAKANRCLAVPDEEEKKKKKKKGEEEKVDTDGHYTPWLTPASSDGNDAIVRPGLVDVALAGWVQYLRIVLGCDVLEGEELGELRQWWERFRTQDWFVELEELTLHPQELKFLDDLEF